MSRVELPAQVPCDMVRNCPRAWVVFEAKRGGKVIEVKRSCRQHATTAIAYMHTLTHVRIEVRPTQ